MYNSLLLKFIPPKSYVALGNQMFLLSLVLMIFTVLIYDLGEAFIAVEVGIIHYLFNLRFKSKKSTWLGTIHPLIATLVAVPLSMIPTMYAPFSSAIFVFLLVITENDNHHENVPKYILPLTFLLLSMIMPVDISKMDLITQRSVLVLLGVVVANFASTLVWPNEGSDELLLKKPFRITILDFKYSCRKALGIGLVLLLSLLSSGGAALGAYLFMMIHSPFTSNLAPKAWQRLIGTIIGLLIYLPIGLSLCHLESNMLVMVIVYGLVVLSLYGILIYLQYNYIIASSLIIFLILIITVGKFNSDMVEIIFSQRLWFTIISGGAMIALGFLIPLSKKDIER
ncbi:hypothetical protein AAFX24_22230 [Vibrio mediterranei]